MLKKRQGFFIVLEGPDRTGKSTQSRLLADFLKKRGQQVVHTREPGGTAFAEAIRRVLLDPRHDVHPVAEILLYEASRAQHTHEKIIPALKAGKTVLCERYTLSTTAYQGYGRGLDLKMVAVLNKIATSGLRPDFTVVMDMPDSFFVSRGRKLKSDRLERASALFRARVRRAYRKLAAEMPRTALIRADRPPEQVQAHMRLKIARALGLKP
ncbi:MAG: dTMP kinase [Elusimicrobia bacterium]|nr:dTMP kinase [Elusimicrobiota bacterium]